MTLSHNEPQGVLVLPHLRIQNANAISSPLTHGFPSVSAFLGFMWALERRMAKVDIPLVPEKIGVICHWHEEQVQDGYVKTFSLPRNPVSKDGRTMAIVEEGRIHLDITLVIQVYGGDSGNEKNLIADKAQHKKIAWQIRDIVNAMRIAGGVVLPEKPAPGRRSTPSLIAWPDTTDEQNKWFRTLRRQCLPGFALVSRDDLLLRRLQQLQEQEPDTSLLEAWLDLARFNYRSQTDPNGKVTWAHDRPEGGGWIVPIPVGYGALSKEYEAGEVSNARDSMTPFRFVESLYSIGQWISPHHLQSIHDFLWWAESDTEKGMYRCRNGYKPPATDEVGADFNLVF